LGKNAIRKKITNQRNRLSPIEAKKLSDKIQTNVLNLTEFKKAKCVLFYHPFKNEVATYKLINYFLKKKLTASLPVITKDGNLKAYRTDLTNLICNKYNILEPDTNKNQEQPVEKIDIILVPGVAFDYQKQRLGYGLGYYDKFLAQKNIAAKKIGLAYNFQLSNKLPSCAHDIKMDIIITEKGELKSKPACNL
jgi:5-formyltetrahydrofolate cyclo-ligase